MPAEPLDWAESSASAKFASAWARLGDGAASARSTLSDWNARRRTPWGSRETEESRAKGQRSTLYDQFQDWMAEAMPFSWSERAHNRKLLRRRATPVVAILVCAVVALGVGVFALDIAGHAAGALANDSPATVATPGGAVIVTQPNPITNTPTPAAPAYTLGVWVSNTMPNGGSVTVYVRVSQNGQPVPGSRVTVAAVTPNGVIHLGPLTTNAYGEASATLNFGNVGSQRPIFLNGVAIVGGKQFTTQYTFVTY